MPRSQKQDSFAWLEEAVNAEPQARRAYEDAVVRDRLLEAMIDARLSVGLNQRALAELMGTTQSAVSELERGHVDARLSTLQRYARATGRCLWSELRKEP